MPLTKLYQVVEFGMLHTLNVLKTFRTEGEAVGYLTSDDFPRYFTTVSFSVLPIWTNAGEKAIEKMLKGQH